MRRKKSTQSHLKDSNGAESDEGDDDDEDEEEGKTVERVEAEQDGNESEQMDVESKDNGPASTEDRREVLEATHSYNGHVSNAEAECTDSSVDGIQNGKSSPGNLDEMSGNNSEVQPMEHTSDKRLEPSAEEDAGIGESYMFAFGVTEK